MVSRFKRIANVRQASGRLFTVCTDDHAPAAIRARVRVEDWILLDPSVGDAVVIDAGRVKIASRSCALINDPEVCVEACREPIHEAWVLVLDQLLKTFASQKAAGSFEDLFHARIVALTARLPAADAVCRLLGLGQGMTPAGDDILVGYMAVEHIRGIADLPGAVCTIVGSEAWSRTSDFSASVLEAASFGHVAGDLLRLIESLTQKPSPVTTEAVETYMWNTGHSSGRDTVFGIACGIGNLHACSKKGRQTA